jgi:hypothetical protein
MLNACMHYFLKLLYYSPTITIRIPHIRIVDPKIRSHKVRPEKRRATPLCLRNQVV